MTLKSVALWISRSDPALKLGPIHTVAGRTDGEQDWVTACGLTLPWRRSYPDAALVRIDPNGRRPVCGDCFRDASITDTESI